MRYSSRFFLYAPLALVAILFVAAGWHWWSVASTFSARLEAVNGREIMPGVLFQYRSKRITGFPFSLDGELSDVTLAMGTVTGTTIWHSEKFAMHRLTYGRNEAIFEAAGRQSLEWGGKRLDFAIGALHASAILKQQSLVRFDLDLMGLGSAPLTARRLQLHARLNGPNAEILMEADGIAAKACRVPAKIRVIATITQAGSLMPLLSGERYWAEGLAAWRRNGGVVTTAAPFAKVPAESLPGIEALLLAACY